MDVKKSIGTMLHSFLCLPLICRNVSQAGINYPGALCQVINVVVCVSSFCENSGPYSLHFFVFETIMSSWYNVKTWLRKLNTWCINNRTEKEVMKTLTFSYPSAYACYQNTKLKFCSNSAHVQSGNPSPYAVSEVWRCKL